MVQTPRLNSKLECGCSCTWALGPGCCLLLTDEVTKAIKGLPLARCLRPDLGNSKTSETLSEWLKGNLLEADYDAFSTID